jgi:Glycosyl transferase family 2
MDEPLVDVGMTAHGRPRFMPEAIESILAQTHTHWTLLVWDDGPPGGEIEQTVRPYLADPRVRYVAADRPVSANAAHTEVMGVGEGEFFAFLHDDDTWGPQFMARRVEFMRRHPECGFVFSAHSDIDRSGRELRRSRVDLPEGMVDRRLLLAGFYDENVVDTMHSVLVRRSALEAAGAHLDPDFPRLYDWELWLRLALRNPVGLLGGADDVRYRVHPEQMSAHPGRGMDFLEMFERTDAEMLRHAPELRPPRPHLARRRSSLLLSVALDELARGDTTATRRRLRQAWLARPASILTGRSGAAVAGLLLGRPGRRAVARLRLKLYRRGSL